MFPNHCRYSLLPLTLNFKVGLRVSQFALELKLVSRLALNLQ